MKRPLRQRIARAWSALLDRDQPPPTRARRRPKPVSDEAGGDFAHLARPDRRTGPDTIGPFAHLLGDRGRRTR